MVHGVVQGVMVDVWWGIVERQQGEYDFEAYERLFHKLADAGLKVQAIMSFHAAGTNVGDTCTITLPEWVLKLGEDNPDIFYTDQHGHRNRECLSTGCLHERVLEGRTCIEVYTDFIRRFCAKFDHLLGVFRLQSAVLLSVVIVSIFMPIQSRIDLDTRL